MLAPRAAFGHQKLVEAPDQALRRTVRRAGWLGVLALLAQEGRKVSRLHLNDVTQRVALPLIRFERIQPLQHLLCQVAPRLIHQSPAFVQANVRAAVEYGYPFLGEK